MNTMPNYGWIPRPLSLLMLVCSLSSLWSTSNLVKQVVRLEMANGIGTHHPSDTTVKETQPRITEDSVDPLDDANDVGAQIFSDTITKTAQSHIPHGSVDRLDEANDIDTQNRSETTIKGGQPHIIEDLIIRLDEANAIETQNLSHTTIKTAHPHIREDSIDRLGESNDVGTQNRSDTSIKTTPPHIIDDSVVRLGKENHIGIQNLSDAAMQTIRPLIKEDSTRTIEKTPRIRECSSPENNVDWPFQGTIESSDAAHTCGLHNSNTNSFTKFLSNWIQEDNSKGCDTVVYGVAFGTDFVDYLNSTVLIDHKERFQHDRCFFTIVLEEDLKRIKFPDEGAQVVGVPRHILPYRNLRRNVKLFKFSGHLIFPSAKKIVWQDAKFFTPTFIWKQPQEYSSLGENTKSYNGNSQKACLVATSMPNHPNVYGEENFNTVGYRPKFRDHCSTILSALQKRPNVTDSARNLLHQCDLYMRAVGNNDTILDYGLLDSAFLIWNYDTDECRNFNAMLQCNILDQIHCYSDRDQVSIPFTFSLMDLVAETRVDTRQNDFWLVEKGNPSEPRIHMTRSACHWYFSRVGQCRSPLPSIAVIVAGTANRFLLNTTLHHLLDAATETYRMDYFAYLTTGQAKMYRQDDYTSKLVYDPIFEKDRPSGAEFFSTIRHHLDLRNIYHETVVRHYPATISNPVLKKKRRKAKAQYPKEHEDLRFPALDLRPHVLDRASVGNNNMLKLFNHIEILWNEKVLPVETMLGKPYDYVLVLRDDVLWLDDFNLTAVTSYRSSQADAYMLSCDARDPPMLPCEMNDHGILVRRSKAGIFGNYLSTMLGTDMEVCHAKVRSAVGEDRGCNSEMILKHIIESNNVTYQPVPSALMPFERSLTVRHERGKIEHCFHKMCQSKDYPLVIPSNMRRCTEIMN